MHWHAKLYEKIASENIRDRPEILVSLHRLGEAEKRARELAAAKAYYRLANVDYQKAQDLLKFYKSIGYLKPDFEPILGAIKIPAPRSEEMGIWLMKHRKIIEDAIAPRRIKVWGTLKVLNP
jgi:hypothetical protein